MESQAGTGIFEGADGAGWRAVLLLLNAIPDPAWIKDARGRYVAINPAYLAEFQGLPGRQRAEDVIGLTAAELHSPDNAAVIEAEDAALLRSGGFMRSERSGFSHDGRLRHFQINRFALVDDVGAIVGTMGIAHDVSARVALTARLSDSEHRLATLLRNLPGTVIRMRPGNAAGVEFVSAGVRALTGYLVDEFVDGVRSWASIIHEHDRDRVLREVREQLAGAGRYEVAYRIVRYDGQVRHVRERGIRQAVDGPVDAYVFDTTEAHDRMARLEHLAWHDELTGLSNRRGLLQRIEIALRDAHHPFAVVAIDLDHFRFVNDRLGQSGGDRVLREMSARLRDRLRPGEVAARISADSFALMLHGLPGSSVDARVAGMVEAIRRPMSIGDGELVTTASVGFALYPEHGDEAELLLRRAEAACQAARNAGRDCQSRYAAGIDADGERRLGLMADLRVALREDRLHLHYQPICALADGSVVGIEALLRWRHPQHGDIEPTEFVALAESSGLIGALGDWVLHRACADLAALRGCGHALHHVAVNLSVMQLRDDRILEQVAHALAGCGLTGSSLALEVTESCAVFDPDNVLRRLQALRGLGLGLVMDDFGTGYSSLAQLRSFPIDRIKLDRMFISEIEHDIVAERICEVVTTLAHALQLEVIAEGVETASQRGRLARMGCDFMQGYLVSRPLPLQDLSDFLDRFRLVTPHVA